MTCKQSSKITCHGLFHQAAAEHPAWARQGTKYQGQALAQSLLLSSRGPVSCRIERNPLTGFQCLSETNPFIEKPRNWELVTGKRAEETERDKAGRKGESESVAAAGPRGIRSEEMMELPWWSSGRDSKLPLQGMRVPAPVGELKSHILITNPPSKKVRRLWQKRKGTQDAIWRVIRKLLEITGASTPGVHSFQCYMMPSLQQTNCAHNQRSLL